MTNLDDATVERIIEQITHEVLVLVEDGQADADGVSVLSAKNYVDRVGPVVSAGAMATPSCLLIPYSPKAHTVKLFAKAPRHPAAKQMSSFFISSS